MGVDLSRSRRTPYAHQLVGVERMTELVEPEVGRVYPGCFFLADDMRLGKTKQTIDTAQVLYERGEIDNVIVVAPAPVRGVWYDPSPDFGEIAKHTWEGLSIHVHEYHSRTRAWTAGPRKAQPLHWWITNYEFIRYGLKRTRAGWVGPRLAPLLDGATERTLLVLDESSSVKTHNSLQTRACMALRQKCGRVILLNGTPISQSPGDLYAQAAIMDPRIIGCPSWWSFRGRYALMATMNVGERSFQSIVGWRHRYSGPSCHCSLPEGSSVHLPGLGVEDLQEKLSPYILRRIRSECLDLPPKLDPVTLTVTLSEKTWRVYKALQKDLFIWLSENTTASAPQAGALVMRLAQITSGFLGGVMDEAPCEVCKGNPGQECVLCGGVGIVYTSRENVETIGSEKLSFIWDWIKQRRAEDPEFRMIIWCRFLPELHRAFEAIEQSEFDGRLVKIHGGQKKAEREEALRLFHPEYHFEGPGIMLGTLGTGAVGINLAGAHEVVYLSNNNSLFHRLQSEDRPHGPGQTQPVSYHDVVAVGPKGQKTIDHAVVKALRTGKNMATWTCSAWLQALKEVGDE